MKNKEKSLNIDKRKTKEIQSQLEKSRRSRIAHIPIHELQKFMEDSGISIYIFIATFAPS